MERYVTLGGAVGRRVALGRAGRDDASERGDDVDVYASPIDIVAGARPGRRGTVRAREGEGRRGGGIVPRLGDERCACHSNVGSRRAVVRRDGCGVDSTSRVKTGNSCRTLAIDPAICFRPVCDLHRVLVSTFFGDVDRDVDRRSSAPRSLASTIDIAVGARPPRDQASPRD